MKEFTCLQTVGQQNALSRIGANWWMPLKWFSLVWLHAWVNGAAAHQCWVKGTQEVKKTIVITDYTEHMGAVDW